MRDLKNPEMAAMRLISPFDRHGTHPYRHPVIGHLEVFNQVTRDDLVAYYRGRYIPNNIFFVVVGDVVG